MGNLKRILDERGITRAEFAKATGISKSTVSEWYNGKYTPKADKLQKASEYLDVPVEHLIDSSDNMKDRSERIPVYDVSAGHGRVNGSYATEYMDDEQTDVDSSWCTVCGDSMYPELKDGDKVRVHHQTETTPQDLTVVKIDGESCTVKYVEITDTGVWLRAINKDVFEDRFYGIREVMQLPVKIIGKVVEVRREY